MQRYQRKVFPRQLHTTRQQQKGQTGSIKNGGANGAVNENERSFDDRDTHRFGTNQSPYKTYEDFKNAIDNIDEEIIKTACRFVHADFLKEV